MSDRTKEIGKSEEIEAWVGFDFNGRGGKYSSMKYNWNHFNATDHDAKTNTNAIYKFLGKGKKGWSNDVDDELGNYDYLCASRPWTTS
jgi:alpha-amylase